MAKSMPWQSLSLPWQTAVCQAWEAYCAGSLPIGAVIVDERNGRIVAEGRNGIHEPQSELPLHGSRLAHAEMNALVSLSQTSILSQNCTLYTTMEPCMMCMGAIRMMRIGTVQFACLDPVAGSSCLVETKPYQAFGPLPVYTSENNGLAELLLVIFVEAMLRTGRQPWVDIVETAVPQPNAAIELGKTLFANGELWQLGQQALAIEQLFAWLQTCLDG
ncbi:nucleoside deaminase [Candidatus Leptofilum sp.]|uniref:nucleoside deaminase n=1 Tax=Candidatus Leptofilum sp. TaxID=3241576 RepID=UPI003B5B1C17